MKCERNILIEIKKKKQNTFWKATFRLRHWLSLTCCSPPPPIPPAPLPPVLQYQKSKSHLNLTLIRTPSWLFVCARMTACEWEYWGGESRGNTSRVGRRGGGSRWRCGSSSSAAPVDRSLRCYLSGEQQRRWWRGRLVDGSWGHAATANAEQEMLPKAALPPPTEPPHKSNQRSFHTSADQSEISSNGAEARYF